MANFSDEIKETLLNLGQSAEGAVARKPHSGFMPGDIVLFNYPPLSEQRMTLVVSNKRGSGIFISSRGNKLVSCFRLNDASSEILPIILQNLYKNRKKASYSGILKGLSALLGSRNYRTYKLNNMRHLYNVNLNMEII